MDHNVELKGKMKSFVKTPLLLTLLLIVLSVAAFFLDIKAGYICLGFTAVYFIIVLIIYKVNKPQLINELVDFAADYGTVQHRLLEDFEIPYALLDYTGKLMWMNKAFATLTGLNKSYHKSVATIFPQITRELLEKNSDELSVKVSLEGRDFRASINKTYFADIMGSSDVIDTEDKKQSLNVVYLFEETELNSYKKINNDIQMVSALVYIDNYDELMDSVEEVKQSLLVALIDRKVSRYFTSLSGLVKKTEKDKYFVVMPKKSLDKIKDEKMSLLEDIKTIKIGNDNVITLSVGMGFVENNYQRSYEYSRTAVDLALGRGGDQAVLKMKEETLYFGEGSRQKGKSTRVKARVKAQALREIMISRGKFYIMGHSIADIDSFGAAVGLYCAARQMGKKAQIVLNQVTTSLRPMVELFDEEHGYPADMIISSTKAINELDSETVLIVVDTNRPSYTESPQLLSLAKTVLVFDHHRQNEEVIKGADLSYIEPYASSVCEMIAEVLQYFDEDIKLSSREADAIYGGILIDTNNFMTKTGVRTFEAAAYLRRCGAEVTRVRKLLRNDMEAYKARAAAVTNAIVYRDSFAISTCPADKVESPTIACAQAANELLNIVGIKASFVLTLYNNVIYVSARSIDEINVQRIMEKLGGGGHMNSAGAQLRDMGIDQAVQIIKSTLDEIVRENTEG